MIGLNQRLVDFLIYTGLLHLAHLRFDCAAAGYRNFVRAVAYYCAGVGLDVMLDYGCGPRLLEKTSWYWSISLFPFWAGVGSFPC